MFLTADSFYKIFEAPNVVKDKKSPPWTQHSTEKKRMIGNEALNASLAEREAIGEKHGVSHSSVYLWAKLVRKGDL